jgi:hypothetical protein
MDLQSDMMDSSLYFDMSRMNKKNMKQRSEKEILEALFVGNNTCTSMELRQSERRHRYNVLSNNKIEENQESSYDFIEI